MAESRTVVVVLNGSNYITWKIGSSGSQAAGSRRLCGRFRMLDQRMSVSVSHVLATLSLLTVENVQKNYWS